MTFFERQDSARRRSRWLVALFLGAMLCMVAAMDIVAIVLWYVFQFSFATWLGPTPAWLHVLVIAGTVALIVAMSIRKLLEVHAGGGMAIAQMLDARQVVPVKATPLERRLLNIVQEMSIAAGLRVPIVYVLDQHGGINAFAAGFESSLCVIVVTRGALERLTRDELQGVIGHEFSHIVNGDMGLNTAMIGMLAGLLCIGAAGDHILREMANPAAGEGRAIVPALATGILLFAVGYIGLFFGRVIKAMVAREREYLADAGSLQFTRNPEGLAGALDQVRRSHSTVLHLHAEDVSHLFFAEAIYLDEEWLLSTHPPLAERIGRLAPGFRETEYRERRLDPLTGTGAASTPPAPAERPWQLTPHESSALVGTLEQRHIDAAAALLRVLPPGARASLETRDGSAALLLALLLSSDATARDAELAAVRGAGLATLATLALQLVSAVTALPLPWQLPVADLALAELRTQPEAYRADVIRAVEAIIDSERTVSVYRFAYVAFVRSKLASGAQAQPGLKSIVAMREDVVLMLSLFAYAGCADAATAPADVAKAFEAGAREMSLAPAPHAVARERCDAQTVSSALERLRGLAPLAKARLVRGLFAAITADGVIRVVEAALLRMVGAVLDCPLPPLIDELSAEELAE